MSEDDHDAARPGAGGDPGDRDTGDPADSDAARADRRTAGAAAASPEPAADGDRDPAAATDRPAVADATPGRPARVPMPAVGPSQLFLSAAKLEAVVGDFEFARPADHGPLPVFALDGDWHLADGHHRAFAAHLGGADDLRVYRDPAVREDHDFGVYRTCVDWCVAAGVRTVPDLAGRVLDHADFETEWIERCRRAAQRLDG